MASLYPSDHYSRPLPTPHQGGQAHSMRISMLRNILKHLLPQRNAKGPRQYPDLLTELQSPWRRGRVCLPWQGKLPCAT